jgi:hypothetical protein
MWQVLVAGLLYRRYIFLERLNKTTKLSAQVNTAGLRVDFRTTDLRNTNQEWYSLDAILCIKSVRARY